MMNRIVVIEDDPAIRRGLVKSLQAESYDVLTAANGDDGYRMVREKQPDVCGKGMPAAMMMANLQAAVKTCATKGLTPRELCENVNRVMCDNIAGRGFITFFYAVIDSDGAGRKRCTYCNAGHNPPILFMHDGALDRLDCGGGVLGVFSDWRYEERDVRLHCGDRLLLYTDGITESRNATGEEFGENRLVDLVRRLQQAGAAAMVEQTIAAAGQFNNGHFEDDVTVVAVTVD